MIKVILISNKGRAVNTDLFTCINFVSINFMISCIDVIRRKTVTHIFDERPLEQEQIQPCPLKWKILCPHQPVHLLVKSKTRMFNYGQ